MPKEDLQQDQVQEVLDHLEVLVLGLEVLGLEGLIMVEVAVPALS